MNQRPLERDEIVERLNESTAPVVQKLSEALQQMVVALRPFRPFVQELARISQALAPYVQAIAPYIESFARYNKFVDSVDATGWLPYHTVSIDYVEECGGDIPLLEHRLSIFYKTNWDNIRQDIESRLSGYHISEEAKATFREALSAHEMGHYRCVCRVLFPEIDRAFRVQFFDDKAGLISPATMLDRLNRNASLENCMPREAYGWILFGRLIHHLFERIDDENRTKFERDFVPNRHAALHGLVAYSTHKHSINMIIMADYIFQILTSTTNSPSPAQ